MATAKKTVKKYVKGGPAPSRTAKKITKAESKRDALKAQIDSESPYGMGNTYAGMDPKVKRLDKKVDRLTARGSKQKESDLQKKGRELKRDFQTPTEIKNRSTAKDLEAKRGGAIKMKKGGATRTKKR